MGALGMAIGFSDRFDFSSIVGWELYRVTIDKYHVTFWFEDESCLLNVADRFSFTSADKTVSYTYEIYGIKKSLNLDRVLRVKIADVCIITKDQLDLVFETGDILSVYDNPEFRSWWFLGGRYLDPPGQRKDWSRWEIALSIGDSEVEDLTEGEIRERQRT
jgi:hypothetical protein